MNIKYYTQFINEDLNSSEYSDIKDELKELIEKSLKTSDKKTVEDFTSAFVRSPEDTQIEGLINDSDVYDFYLKYRNDIDQILSDINFYDDVPSEIECFSLYDYIIIGTKKAVKELVSSTSEGAESKEK